MLVIMVIPFEARSGYCGRVERNGLRSPDLPQ